MTPEERTVFLLGQAGLTIVLATVIVQLSVRSPIVLAGFGLSLSLFFVTALSK